MTIFIRTLGAALAAFLLLGGIQEWRSLAAPLVKPATPPSMTAAEQKEASLTVYRFAQLTSHFYASGGDPRFAERLPAAKEIVDEMKRDAAYVRHNQRVQQPSLVRLEVLSVVPATATRCEIRTKEYWTTEFSFASTGARDAMRSDVLHVRYRVVKDGAAWQMVQWDPEDAP